MYIYAVFAYATYTQIHTYEHVGTDTETPTHIHVVMTFNILHIFGDSNSGGYTLAKLHTTTQKTHAQLTLTCTFTHAADAPDTHKQNTH
jgi:hypothetical protein